MCPNLRGVVLGTVCHSEWGRGRKPFERNVDAVKGPRDSGVPKSGVPEPEQDAKVAAGGVTTPDSLPTG